MQSHLHRNLEELKKMILTMGGMVEESIEKAARILRNHRQADVKEVVDEDDAIDTLELKIDDECLKILALYQPVAEDLRFVSVVMKINSDLERLGDLAANMAKRGGTLGSNVPEEMTSQFESMVRAVIHMLRGVLRAFVDRDGVAARRVVQEDDAVDASHKKMIFSLTDYMKATPSHVEPGVQLLWVSRNLERIADHITNMAEDVVYMVEGESIRHRVWEFPEEEENKDPRSPGDEYLSRVLSFKRT